MSASTRRLLHTSAFALGAILTGACGDPSGDAATTGSAGGGASATTSTSVAATSSALSGTSTAQSSGAGGSGGVAVTFEDSYSLTAQYPEGGTYDPLEGDFYIGSLGDGSVHRVNANTGAEEVIFTESAPGKWWSLGMDVDVVRRRLWVCAMDDRSPNPRAGFIWIFDLNTGMRVKNYALDFAAASATCTDVALTQDGNGYVSDREQGNVYRVDFDGGPTLFTSSPDLSASVVGQNSLVVLPDQSALLDILYLPSSLVRIDLLDGSVRPVDITGKFSDFSPLAGADGMAYSNGSVYVAFTSNFIRVTPTVADWSQATSVSENVPSGMTDVIATPGGLYLLNGQSVRFALGTTPDPFALVRYTGAL